MMTSILLALAVHAQAAVPQPRFDAGRAWEHLRQLVAIGPRPSGSAAIGQTRKYIKDQMASLGFVVAEQAWDDETPIDKVHFVNLSVVIPGARKERVVFAGHYDTKLYRQFRFVGASDGASSAAFLIELARVLKGRKNPFTIELLFLDGEEARLPEWNGTDNTYGSRHYVDVAKRDGTIATLKALLLVDMIGDRDLDIRRDMNSTPWLTDILWATAKHQDLDDYFIPDSTRIEDDHLPFLAAGVPSVDIIDLDFDAWHTAKDNLDAVSARSLQVVGDVVLAALPTIEAHLVKQAQVALVHKTTLKRKGQPRKGYTMRLITHRRHPRGLRHLSAQSDPVSVSH
jgi:glutaminyl-peptide cyclotransferase